MRILVAASEAVPFVKTGGLGDVIGALPRALASAGNDVKVFIPGYKSLDPGQSKARPLGWSKGLEIGGSRHAVAADVVSDKRLPLEHYFINNEHFFHRSGLYRDEAAGMDFEDNDERFIFFSRAVLECVKHLEWKPHVIHVHDWQASLIAPYLKIVHSEDPFFAGTRTVLTIHNLAFQGTFDKERYALLDLPDRYFAATAPFEFYGKVNFLKAAIVFADKITTVSPRYAEEIKTEDRGDGLDGVLRQRKDDLEGILNGVDYSVWSPSRDRKIPFRYHINNLSGKRMNKVELLNELSLPVRPATPLIGMISRLTDQKGFDLIAEVADEIFDLNLQMVVLGTGEKKYHELLTTLQQRYPDKLRVNLGFDDGLAHRIEAAADMFLMPSRFEPCGLNQMYSLKYGTVPIVREVGGLADTVRDYDAGTGQGTGFAFREYEAAGLLEAIGRAVDLFAGRRAWTRLVKAGMKMDYSWDRSAEKYADLFQRVVKL